MDQPALAVDRACRADKSPRKTYRVETASRRDRSRRRKDFLPARDPCRAIGWLVADKKRLAQVLQVQVVVAIERDHPIDQGAESRQRPCALFDFAADAVHLPCDPIEK